jgi:hypothetical protein
MDSVVTFLGFFGGSGGAVDACLVLPYLTFTGTVSEVLATFQCANDVRGNDAGIVVARLTT